MKVRTVITGTGCYIPGVVKTNQQFIEQEFYDDDAQRITTPSQEIVDKFQKITGIEERRYINDNMNSSDMAVIAARLAIEESGIDPEELDQIILAHNFGNVIKNTIQTDVLPALASRVKHELGIKNPNCVAYDILFGCPGWVQGVIQADSYFKAGIAKKALVIGTETLSRVLDMYDRDCMIFSDGAGASVLEARSEDEINNGILSWSVQSHCIDEAYYLYLGKSNFPGADSRIRYIKMKGKKVYEYAMQHVPAAMKDCLDKAGIPIQKVKKIFIHQANEKMDEGIIRRLFKLYGLTEIPEHIMPMSIHKFGNSSVATIPTLFDMVKKGQVIDHSLNPGDVILFASVGAGMNINAVCYRI
ncbi:MAG: ketoacyl-ACP synthase III [Chitinophagaceae bacterium]|nr:ketoacyl-ACP synthase III [Chitinophagaceae bacterium]MBL0130455.1 ketoacyl-ACP synthase III [Chitinophagaceae bacterium]MBL0272378.1 ketoacyl-ACP synthase III [Chitinophagaceae bacterium]